MVKVITSGLIVPNVVTPTVTVGAYSAGYCVGGALTIPAFRVNGGSGYVPYVSVSCKIASFVGQFDVFFFSSVPTATDFAAYNMNVADIPNLISVRHCNDLTASGTGPVVLRTQFESMAAWNGNSTTNLYAVVVTRSAVTFTGTSDITLVVSVDQA